MTSRSADSDQGNTDRQAGTAPQDKRRTLRVDVAWLGAAGVALYVFLRIPFAIFYEQLGTSPEEVGLGYAQLLAQSSVLVALVAAAASGLTFNLIFGAFPTAFLTIGTSYRKWNGGGREVLAQMTDAEFNEYLAAAHAANTLRLFGRKLMAGALRRQTRLRELDRKGVLDKKETKESRGLYHGVSTIISRPLLGFIYEANEKRYQLLALFLLWSFAIMAFILPLLADHQARIVKDCGTADSIAGMSYGGTKVELLDSTTLNPRFEERSLLLLGGDSSKYVLFDCTDDTTLRLPASNYVVIHKGQ
ncbi:hypothetical protein ACS5PJ_19860 [Pseudarthrobacter sp. YS3]|uniref:hypothetical protein n=1 Tax=Pseudarthrobacter sp. YS3 TaxID=3453718 RepID=UPI003EE9C4D1